MKIRARFFNSRPSDASLLVHGHEWEIRVADDASGREMVRAAMLAADWPERAYSIKYERRNQQVNVEVSIEEKPSQLITLMVMDEKNLYAQEGFTYRAPVHSQLPQKIAKRAAMVGLFFVCWAAMFFIAARHLYCAILSPQRAKGIAIAIDRAANGAFNGSHNETISSRANRARVHGRRWGCVLCKFLDWFKKGHCEDSAGK